MLKAPDGWKKVESSNIFAVRHDTEKKELYVMFKAPAKEPMLHKIYRYENVDSVLFTKFVSSPSKGKFLNAEIKPKKVCIRALAVEKTDQPSQEEDGGSDGSKETAA